MFGINYPNAELKQTAIPGKFIGWREKNGAFQQIAVTVEENSPLVDGIIETVSMTITTKILQSLNPQQIENEI